MDIGMDPLYHLADINYSCFVGAQEAYTILLKYVGFVNTPMTLVYNLLFNFGLIYASVMDVVTFFALPARSGAKTPADLGA